MVDLAELAESLTAELRDETYECQICYEGVRRSAGVYCVCCALCVRVHACMRINALSTMRNV